MAAASSILRFPEVRVLPAFVPHTHNESSLHWAVEKMGGVLFDFSKAVDYATQWADYYECPSEVKENAGKVKGVVDRINVFFAGFSFASAVHEALDADDKSFGVGELAGVLSSGAEFIDRLDGFGAINLMEGASPVIAGIGVSADVIGGLYDSAAVLRNGHIGVDDSQGLVRAKQSTLYKLVKIAENVACVALAALSGYGTYCALFAVAAPPLLPFTLLALGTAALSIKMMRCFYEGLADDEKAQNLESRVQNRESYSNCGSQGCQPVANFSNERANARLKQENRDLRLTIAELGGIIKGLERGLESWASHKPVHIFNVGNHEMSIDDRRVEESRAPVSLGDRDIDGEASAT